LPAYSKYAGKFLLKGDITLPAGGSSFNDVPNFNAIATNPDRAFSLDSFVELSPIDAEHTRNICVRARFFP